MLIPINRESLLKTLIVLLIMSSMSACSSADRAIENPTSIDENTTVEPAEGTEKGESVIVDMDKAKKENTDMGTPESTKESEPPTTEKAKNENTIADTPEDTEKIESKTDAKENALPLSPEEEERLNYLLKRSEELFDKIYCVYLDHEPIEGNPTKLETWPYVKCTDPEFKSVEDIKKSLQAIFTEALIEKRFSGRYTVTASNKNPGFIDMNGALYRNYGIEGIITPIYFWDTSNIKVIERTDKHIILEMYASRLEAPENRKLEIEIEDGLWKVNESVMKVWDK